MGNRPRQDRQQTLQKATQLFWEKGFHATSMRNIQQVIDMRPGSIYASFGSKEGLFKAALQCYADDSLTRIAACIDASSSPLAALRTIIRSSVVGQHESPSADMCMLVKTIAELTDENADLLAESKRLLNAVGAAFTDLILLAQASGEIDASKDAGRVARLLQVQIMGLRAYVNANDGCEQVNELIDDALASLQ